MAEFGKLNFAVSFNPQTAFPLDARYYFATLEGAQAAAAGAVEVGSSDGTYFYGENVCVVTESSADLYIIQPDKTLKAVGSAVLGDGQSIEVVDGKVTMKGFASATAGQQPRINAAGDGIEWYTPDTSTVSGLSETVAGHTSDIANLQTNKADKATTLEGYGITDAMTATDINAAIQSAIAGTSHAVFKKVDAVPSVEEAEDNVLYLVMNSTSGFYDIYAKVDTEVVRLDDVSVNLDGYATTEAMDAAIAEAVAGKVDAVPGKGLSTNDYTDEDAAKLAALDANAEENYVKSVNEDELTVSAEGRLSLTAVAMSKVTGLDGALAGKVDAVAGKGLSTNDFTTVQVQKLAGIEDGAQANIIESITLDGGEALSVEGKTINIPAANTNTVGLLSPTDKVKLDAIDLDALATKAEVSSLEESVTTISESLVWGSL